MSTRYVVGMANSYLDLVGSRARNLELDFLRLAYSVEKLRACGDEGKGYLLVLAPAVARRVSTWERKYDTVGKVEVLASDPTEEELATLRREKKQNRAGVADALTGHSAGSRSQATYGERLAEEKLRDQMPIKEPGVLEVTEKSRFPLGIQWDYFGEVAE